MAGRLLRSGPPAGLSVQRGNEGSAAPEAPAATDEATSQDTWVIVEPMGDDAQAHVARTKDLFEAADTLRPDSDFTRNVSVFHPIAAVVHFEDCVIGADRAGKPLTVLRQNTMHPVMTGSPIVLLHESATTNV